MQKSQNTSQTKKEKGVLPDKGWSYRGYLPHFDNGEVIQFVTFRLYDSVPEDVITQWKAELNWRENAADDSQEAIELYKKIELYADVAHGQCFLKDKRIAQLVEHTLLHFDRQRYELYEWRVMPNHAHLLCKMLPGWELGKTVHTWKSYTAHKVNEILSRTGQFWMVDYYDRYIRDETHFLKTIKYIRNNGQ